MNRIKKLSKDDINSLDIIRFDGEISVVSSSNHLQNSINYLKDQSIIGFDTETRPIFVKGRVNAPSILQLAGQDKVFIYQLDSIDSLIPIFEILSNKNITKCGVSVDRDLIELMFFDSFDPCSFIDLGDIARATGIPHHGLRGLVALFIKKRISKGAQISDWSRKKLSRSQILYAATDAWISLQLFKYFEKEKLV